ncbi:MAG TPA: tetratricopeptide repeat protein [Opitutaceae bacterium]|nr:tetratricopeptide repeat protein [Opitutaceae bacterium]
MRLRWLFLSLALVSLLRAGTPFEDAVALYQEKKYPDARAAFEKIVAAEPNNAAACHYLGLTLLRRGDAAALGESVKWMEKAAAIEPGNATYLADFGGTSMQLAGRTRSIGAATKGRDAMEKSLTLDPNNLDAREGLWRFYTEAPWPLGSSGKAAKQLEEIGKRDPDRATVMLVLTKANAKDYAAAFKLCEDILAKNPANYTALYQYGRTASVSGQNLERGLEYLQKCLAVSPSSPSSPQPTHVWNRIGAIQEKLGRTAEARAAYETAVKLDATNKAARDALARLP